MKREQFFHITVLFFVIVFALPIYFQSIDAPFFYDDVDRIQRNLDHMHKLDWYNACFSPIPSRPLFNIVLYLFSCLGLQSPNYLHYFSVSIHIFNALLLYIFIGKFQTLFSKNIALFASMIFFVHPLAGEGVHYIHSFPVLLGTFFSLITIILFSGHFLRQEGRKCWRLGWSLLSAFLAYMSKESFVVLPLLLCVTSFFLLKMRWTVKRVILMAIYFLQTGVIFLLLIYQGNAHGATSGFNHYSALSYLFTQMHYAWFTLSLYFLPDQQSIYHHLALQPFHFSPGFLGISALIIIYIIAIFRNKVRPQIHFSILWIGVVLLPTNTIYPIKDILTEYRLYPTLIGFSILAAYAVSCLNFTRSVKYFLAAAMFFYFSLFSYGRALLWRDPTTLWLDALDKYPRSTRVLNNLGTSYIIKKNYSRAEPWFKSAIKLNSNEFFPYHNLGIISYHENRFEEAVNLFLSSSALNPRYPYSYYYLGLCHEKLGNEEKKKEYFKKFKDISPG